jgi:hypothetical protein
MDDRAGAPRRVGFLADTHSAKDEGHLVTIGPVG